MFGRFMPTEGKFFEIFNAHAKCMVDASRELELLIDNLDEAEVHKQNVQANEKRADKLTHETIDLLHKTFITPLDRDEIHKLITTMDDILDLMEDVATAISLYDVRSVTSEASQLAHIVTATVVRVQQAVELLADMKRASEILKICEEIDRLESDADRVLRSAMSKLFREEDDVKTLIKLKAIYELLETITDKCEDVANIIEGIVLENA
ncbi:Phosphate transport regulator (distant of PhoU) [Candidatus Burkholderia humilis]|nr:Phosphate transport regulator (distant of PhoU) [Candidatus Burkholderia humilis]